MPAVPASISCYVLEGPNQLSRSQRPVPALGQHELLVEVAGCGVCHTDIGFFAEGVRPKHPLPLTLGHEISGRVVLAGDGARELEGRAVVVSAVTPCGECLLCRSGRGSVCRSQVFVGSDSHGGFASHAVVPARGVAVVDEVRMARQGVSLPSLGVLADAVATAYQALVRAGLRDGDVAIFIGTGGVGGFGVQIARALGAHAIALDVDDERLATIADFGAEMTLNPRGLDPKDVRKRINEVVKANLWPDVSWRIVETSGTAAGQELGFGLLGYDSNLSVVGYTLDKVSVRLSNLMAFHATAQGNWGCLPEHFPQVLELVASGRVRVAPFVEERPMSRILETFNAIKDKTIKKRPVLIPDFGIA
ncbi:MAG: 6-hydroxycyclohex-1-ene-1-carbonyl-CoA dehydrogenase [Deltaproteobacteria bacterium]|nr:6-hydroxycyclohex-1-ene-1-carbonyl-CoA dehydrogenase [Deltaproteobacteria bacterium]